MTAKNPNPRFQHDCDDCKFLGTIVSKYQPNAPYADLYACRDNSLIARYGSDGPDYSSMPMELVQQHQRSINSDLVEALARHLQSPPYLVSSAERELK